MAEKQSTIGEYISVIYTLKLIEILDKLINNITVNHYKLETIKVISNIIITLSKNLYNSKLTDGNIESILLNYLNYYDNLNNPMMDNLNNPITDNLNNPITDNLNNPITDNLNNPITDNLNNPMMDNLNNPVLDNTIIDNDILDFINATLTNFETFSNKGDPAGIDYNTELYDDSDTDISTNNVNILKYELFPDYTTKRGRRTRKINYKI
uniref:Uncharacterized protein n=1 Tax=viral metagenome TaxID=1070528 RepID=A0A6C0EI41_9ZZZZ